MCKFIKVTLGVTWTHLIYIYIYINCLLIDYESKKQIEINIYNNKCKNRISHAKTTFPKGPIPSPK